MAYDGSSFSVSPTKNAGELLVEVYETDAVSTDVTDFIDIGSERFRVVRITSVLVSSTDATTVQPLLSETTTDTTGINVLLETTAADVVDEFNGKGGWPMSSKKKGFYLHSRANGAVADGIIQTKILIVLGWN